MSYIKMICDCGSYPKMCQFATNILIVQFGCGKRMEYTLRRIMNYDRETKQIIQTETIYPCGRPWSFHHMIDEGLGLIFPSDGLQIGASNILKESERTYM